VFEGPATCLIGRAGDCDIQLPLINREISRHHCLLEIDAPMVRVRDLGSCNGTYVNGEMIGRRLQHPPAGQPDSRTFASRDLKDTDELELGSFAFRVDIVLSNDKMDAPTLPVPLP
jgi:pSer/pThr/pTyr-binding forkhead associated (FHA) protein